MQGWALQVKVTAFGPTRPNLSFRTLFFIGFCYGSEVENENVLSSDFTNRCMVLSFFTVL